MPQTSHIYSVQASAGSGKTYALAQRYVSLLMKNAYRKDTYLRAILAITFTNKAAVEMKERIIEFLKKIALESYANPQEKKELLAACGLASDEAARVAHAVLKDIMRHYSFFQVKTIDSFINALLLGCSSAIQRSAGFRIRRDARKWIEYSFDSLIERARTQPDIRALFEDFLEHYLLVENRTAWFPRKDILALLNALYRLHTAYDGNLYVYAGSSKNVRDAKSECFGDIARLAGILPEGMNKTALKSIEAFIAANDRYWMFDALPKCLAKEGPPMNKNKIAGDESLRQWHAIYERVRVLAQQDAFFAYQPYTRVYNLLSDILSTYQQQEDTVFLEELNRMAAGISGRNEGLPVSEVYYRIAGRFSHYLIDEFQDTSRLQWNNLFRMIEEALSSGGSLFYVGDTKQAIYRFRGGDARLFNNVRQELAQFSWHDTLLNTNWRSRALLVEFFNAVFSRENLTRGIIDSGIAEEIGNDTGRVQEILSVFDTAAQSARSNAPGGYIHITRIPDEGRADAVYQACRAQLLAHVRDVHARFPWHDIGILCRKNNDVELVSGWLLAAGIPAESEKSLMIRNSPYIREIVSLLAFLDSPLDDISFAAFIAGDIFSRAANISGSRIRGFITKRRDASPEQALYRIFRDEFPEAWKNTIEEFFRSVGFVSVYELTASIYRVFSIDTRFPEHAAYFLAFLECIKKQEEECSSLTSFLEYFAEAEDESMFVKAGSYNAVRVLTVHKAKGLEYEAVIIPMLRMDIVPESADKKLKAYIDESCAPQRGLVRVTKAHCVFSPVLTDLYQTAYARACIDELNALYVALTRARSELRITITPRSGQSKNPAAHFIPAEKNEWGAPVAQTKRRHSADSYRVITPAYAHDWVTFLRSEFGSPSELRNRGAIRYGTIMHAMLSRIGDISSTDTAQALDEALRYGEKKFSITDITPFQNALHTCLNSDTLKKFFYCAPGRVWCEKEYSNAFGDLKRVDRIIEYPDELWIIDYKSSQDGPCTHADQINEYRAILARIYPQKQIRGWVVYIDTGEALEIGAYV